jgi:hypothetical protein
MDAMVEHDTASSRRSVVMRGQVKPFLFGNPQRLTAFNESFLMLAALCALAVVAAWQLREKNRNAATVAPP